MQKKTRQLIAALKKKAPVLLRKTKGVRFRTKRGSPRRKM